MLTGFVRKNRFMETRRHQFCTKSPRRWRRLCLPAAAVVVFAAGFPALSAAAQRCPGAADPVELKFQTFSGEASYRTGHSRGDLQRIQRGHGGAGSAGGWYPLGLTLTEFKMDMRLNVKIYPLSRNGFCAVPETLDIRLSYPDFTVYIDRRYRRGTCEYRAIRDHEDQHVAVYRQELERFEPWFRKRLVAIIQRLKPVAVADPERAAALVQARIKYKVAPLLRKVQDATDSANARVDTPSNYRLIHSRCRNWKK